MAVADVLVRVLVLGQVDPLDSAAGLEELLDVILLHLVLEAVYKHSPGGFVSGGLVRVGIGTRLGVCLGLAV